MPQTRSMRPICTPATFGWSGTKTASPSGLWASLNGLTPRRQAGGFGASIAGSAAVFAAATGRGCPLMVYSNGNTGRGVNRQLPHLGSTGQREAFLRDWFGKIKARFEGVRVACGDWTRVCGPSVLRSAGGVTGIFFDPPYDLDMRTAVYANESNCAADVMKWCIDHGNDKDLRIVLAGYDGEHNRLEAHGWRVHAWKAAGGFGGGRGQRGDENASKERLWFSPQCLDYQAQGVLL